MTEGIPRVSVILPTCNRAHLVGQAIQSVLDQTYRDFELIVVDDGSTDNTEKVVESFNDDRLKYIRHRENKGVSAARNTGIEASRGEYIAFQDDDDGWLPEKLDRQMRVFDTAAPEVGVVYVGYRRLVDSQKAYMPFSRVAQKEGNIFSSLLRGNFIAQPAVLVKRECFERVGLFDEHISFVQDWELLIRISKMYQFKYIDELLVISYYQEGSLSASQSDRARALGQVLEKHFEDIRKDRRVLASNYLRIGDLLCSDGELSQGRRYLIGAVKTHPPNIKALCAALASLLNQSAYNKAAASYRTVRDWFSEGQ